MASRRTILVENQGVTSRLRKSGRPPPRGRGAAAILMPEGVPSYAPPRHCGYDAGPKLTDRYEQQTGGKRRTG